LTIRIPRDKITACGRIGLFFIEEKPTYGAEGVRVVTTQITLECTVCKNRNYSTTKNKRTNPERMEFNKYCKFCKKTTPHKETK